MNFPTIICHFLRLKLPHEMCPSLHDSLVIVIDLCITSIPGRKIMSTFITRLAYQRSHYYKSLITIMLSNLKLGLVESIIQSFTHHYLVQAHPLEKVEHFTSTKFNQSTNLGLPNYLLTYSVINGLSSYPLGFMSKGRPLTTWLLKTVGTYVSHSDIWRLDEPCLI